MARLMATTRRYIANRRRVYPRPRKQPTRLLLASRSRGPTSLSLTHSHSPLLLRSGLLVCHFSSGDAITYDEGAHAPRHITAFYFGHTVSHSRLFPLDAKAWSSANIRQPSETTCRPQRDTSVFGDRRLQRDNSASGGQRSAVLVAGGRNVETGDDGSGRHRSLLVARLLLNELCRLLSPAGSLHELSTEEGGVRSHEVRRGQSAEDAEVHLQLDHRGQMRSQYRRGRCPVRSHRGQTRSECRGGRGPSPVGSQRSDEVTVQKREASSQVTRGQARSECGGGRGRSPVGSQRSDEVTVQKREVTSQVTRGQSAEDAEVHLQLDHRGQMRSQYRRGRCPVRSHEVRQGQSAEEAEVHLQLDHRGQTRSQ